MAANAEAVGVMQPPRLPGLAATAACAASSTPSPLHSLPTELLERVAQQLAPLDAFSLSQVDRRSRAVVRSPAILRHIVDSPCSPVPRPWEAAAREPLWEQLLLQGPRAKALQGGARRMGHGRPDADVVPSIGNSGRYVAVAMLGGEVRLWDLFANTTCVLPRVWHQSGQTTLALFDQQDVLQIDQVDGSQVLWHLSDLSRPLLQTMASENADRGPWFTLANHARHAIWRACDEGNKVSVFSLEELKSGHCAPQASWLNVLECEEASRGPGLLLLGHLDPTTARSVPTRTLQAGAPPPSMRFDVPARTLQRFDLDTLALVHAEPSPAFWRLYPTLASAGAHLPFCRLSPDGSRAVFGPAGGHMYTWAVSQTAATAQRFSPPLGAQAWDVFSSDGRYYAQGSDEVHNDFVIYDFAANKAPMLAFVPGMHPRNLVHFSADNTRLQIDFCTFDLTSARATGQLASAYVRLNNNSIGSFVVDKHVPPRADDDASPRLAAGAEWTPLYGHDPERIYQPTVAPGDAMAAASSTRNAVLFGVGGGLQGALDVADKLNSEGSDRVRWRDWGDWGD